jgi:hypothetical protein
MAAKLLLSAPSSSLAFNPSHLSLGFCSRFSQKLESPKKPSTLPATLQSDDIFQLSSPSSSHQHYIPLSLQNRPSHVLSTEDMHAIFKFRSKSSGKDKVLNAVGLYHLVVVLLTMPLWMAAMSITHWLGDTVEGFDEHRAKFDYAGKIWCRTYLSLTNSYPLLEGCVDRLKVGPNGKMSEGACLFVANHASFLDIAVLCTVLDPVFKFIAKDSLKKFPGVGTQLVGVSTYPTGLCFAMSN